MREQSNLVILKRVLTRTTAPSVRRGLLALWESLLSVNILRRERSGWAGVLPSFIIIGTQKGGTTSLYDEITSHPCVTPAVTKEVHFFDVNFGKGLRWYQAFFPSYSQGSKRHSKDFITGEASPSYLCHPHAARRISEIVPQVQLLVLLRNPVTRAYSHYHHEVRLGFETLPFAEAIENENERLLGEKEKMLADETYDSQNYRHYSYLARGIYIDQVRVWRQLFPDKQILFLKSEDFYKDTTAVMKRVIAFLGLSDWEPEARRKPKAFPYPQMDAKTRQCLMDYFEPYNQRLYEYLGVDFGWNG